MRRRYENRYHESRRPRSSWREEEYDYFDEEERDMYFEDEADRNMAREDALEGIDFMIRNASRIYKLVEAFAEGTYREADPGVLDACVKSMPKVGKDLKRNIDYFIDLLLDTGFDYNYIPLLAQLAMFHYTEQFATGKSKDNIKSIISRSTTGPANINYYKKTVWKKAKRIADSILLHDAYIKDVRVLAKIDGDEDSKYEPLHEMILAF